MDPTSSLWTTWTVKLPGGCGLRIILRHGGRLATRQTVFRGWRDEAAFCTLFNSLLADAPYTAFRWETPSVSTDTLEDAFECVLLDAPGLERRPDRTAFAEHFDKGEAGIAEFSNLGKDAILVVPLPLADLSAYGHLAAFVRRAPEGQRHALWRAVGEAMLRRVSGKPVWLSTAGAGVPWLHVRLDDRPKYYGYGPYRERS